MKTETNDHESEAYSFMEMKDLNFKLKDELQQLIDQLE